jgi:hypothetical protein
VETIHYFLKRYREGLVEEAEVRRTIERELASYRDHLMGRRARRGALVPLKVGRRAESVGERSGPAW